MADRIADPDKEHLPFLRTSAFLITINTNQRARTPDEFTHVAKPFFLVLNAIFSKAEHVKKFVTVLSTMDSFEDDVGAIKSSGVIEYAVHSGIHAHIMIEIVHRTRVQINSLLLRQIVLQDLAIRGLRLSNLYIQVRFVRNDTQTVLNYVRKDVWGKACNVRGDLCFPERQTVTAHIDIAKIDLEGAKRKA